MNYVITGGAGHTSGAIAEALLAAGKNVTVVGRNANNLKELVSKGAKALIGSLEDGEFLKKAFAGADAVYTMIPPNYAPVDFRSYQDKLANNFIAAIKANNVKHVVNLSSIGAHLGTGAGPIDGLAAFEKQLNALENTAVKHLRPGFFFYNFLSQIPTLKHMGVIGSNYTGDKIIPSVDTKDIAAAGTEELLNLNFTGNSVRYVISEEIAMNDAAKILGAAIGKPDLQWVFVPDEQLKAGMIQGGLSESLAQGYVDMGKAFGDGRGQEDYLKHKNVLGKHKLKDFAPTFAVAVNS